MSLSVLYHFFPEMSRTHEPRRADPGTRPGGGLGRGVRLDAGLHWRVRRVLRHADRPGVHADVLGRLHQAARVGQPLIAWPNSDTDRALDFVALHPGTSSVGGAKMFIYAPDGRISNLCVSEPSQGAALVLRGCNGSAWQVFTAKQVGDSNAYEWVNAATGDGVSADGIRRPTGAGNSVTLCDLGVFADEAAETVSPQNTHVAHFYGWMETPGGRILPQRPVRPMSVVMIGVLAED
jgi:hypothetical protein